MSRRGHNVGSLDDPLLRKVFGKHRDDAVIVVLREIDPHLSQGPGDLGKNIKDEREMERKVKGVDTGNRCKGKNKQMDKLRP